SGISIQACCSDSADQPMKRVEQTRAKARDYIGRVENLHVVAGFSPRFIVFAIFLFASGILSAQQKPLHLNPVIAKLAEGKTVYGLITGDLSLAYARDVARSPVDFIYADLEHNPLDFPSLHLFLMGMTDRAMVLKKGN